MSHQRTIDRPVTCQGIGLHTGAPVTMTLRPAPVNSGVVFCRTDLPGTPTIPATPAHVIDVHYATTIARDGARVKTIEHLMAALAGLGVDNLAVDLAGPEVPAMDGSAGPFVDLIQWAGLRRQLAPRTYLRIREPLRVEVGHRRIEILPSDRLRVAYTMRFDHPRLDEQSFSLNLSREAFIREIAPSRTYGFLRDVEYLQSMGLARGGSLENALVIDDNGIMNGELRFRDELVRHKILDLLGDLYLLGKPVVGTIVASGAGHLLHTRLVHRIQDLLALADGNRGLQGVVERWVNPLLPSSEPLGSPAP